MSFEQRLSRLNDQQRNAVETIDGPVLVVAGPGSGKTELLSLRTANILKKTDALASSILCITYTEAASENMRQRLQKLISKDAYKVFISTFHGLGSFIINNYPEFFFNSAKMEPLDDVSRFEILQKILTEVPIDFSLSKKHFTQGFTYLRSIISSIENLKNAGITPQEFKQILESNKSFLENANPLISDFYSEKITKETLKKLDTLILELKSLSEGENQILKNIRKISENYINLFNEAKVESITEKTKPITKLKSLICTKDENNKFVLKDYQNLSKQLELAEVYQKYQEECEKRALYDYSDMIMETIKVIEGNKALHYELAERFQYIMVDEFQDTNGAQMRLLDAIIDEEITENRPNILAVGDDDQAIYKFQGAKIENILSFHKKYEDVELIVLTKNYRSHQKILSNIRKVILQGEKRLETQDDLNINKDLFQASEIAEGEFSFNSFPTKEEEFSFIAEKIKEEISKNTKLSEIAVLMKHNKDLEALAKVLDMEGIKVSFERKKNILREAHIIELLNLLKFINSLSNKTIFEADYLLPEILSASYLDVPALEIWKISTSVNAKDFWLTKMEESKNLKIKNLTFFLLELAKLSKNESADTIIDLILGNKAIQINEEEYTSPYKEFYFSESEFKNNRKIYLERLKAIQTIISKFRAYKKKEKIRLKDLIKYIEIHEEYEFQINETTKYIDETAVNLITIHSSKGLEFETVFLSGLSEKQWAKRRANLLKFPENLKISKDEEDDDDKIRLLYVGMSRAKRNLHLSFSTESEKSKTSFALSPLCEFNCNELEDKELAEKTPLIIQKLNSHNILNTDENAYLKELLQNYKLSVTHLKNFLDLENGGPNTFIQKNLLRFPEKKSPFAEYGTAVHEAIEQSHLDSKVFSKIIDREYLLKKFDEFLSYKRISRSDYDKYLEKGKKDLSKFYEEKFKFIDINDFTEFNFSKEDIRLDEVKIKGKIDRIHIFEGNKIEVIDYKTGTPFPNWEVMKRKKALKHWHFEMQLYYYKILIENSRRFSKNFTVELGKFEFIEPSRDEQKIQTLEMAYIQEKEEKLKKLIKIVWHLIQNLDFPSTDHYPKNFTGTKAFQEDLLQNYNF